MTVYVGDLADADDLPAGFLEYVQHGSVRRFDAVITPCRTKPFEVRCRAAERPGDHPGNRVFTPQDPPGGLTPAVQLLERHHVGMRSHLEHAVCARRSEERRVGKE